MTASLVFIGQQFDEARAVLLDDARESCAVAFAEPVRVDGRLVRLLAREIRTAPPSAYARRDATAAVLEPGWVMEAANQARRTGLAVVFVHTHPQYGGVPEFSPEDDRGEKLLRAYLDRRAAGLPHAALLLAPGGCRARFLGTDGPLRVFSVGPRVHVLFDPAAPAAVDPVFDRQVRAFGLEGQSLLRRLRVGVVGVGGTGSVTVQQLAHLGVGGFVLVDADKVELHNLNRLVGATRVDIGREKVAVAAGMVRAVNPDAEVTEVPCDVADDGVARALIGCDFLFCCTDTQASRAVVGQLAYQYLLPCINVGVGIAVRGEEIDHVTGRVHMLSPGVACLVCTQSLDFEAVRQELMTPEQRRADRYVQGIEEPQPAVVTLNSTVASLAVTMFLGAVTRVPAGARMQVYDAMRGTVRALAMAPNGECLVCSPVGALARGDRWPLPTRAPPA